MTTPKKITNHKGNRQPESGKSLMLLHAISWRGMARFTI